MNYLNNSSVEAKAGPRAKTGAFKTGASGGPTLLGAKVFFLGLVGSFGSLRLTVLEGTFCQKCKHCANSAKWRLVFSN